MGLPNYKIHAYALMVKSSHQTSGSMSLQIHKVNICEQRASAPNN